MPTIREARGFACGVTYSNGCTTTKCATASLPGKKHWRICSRLKRCAHESWPGRPDRQGGALRRIHVVSVSAFVGEKPPPVELWCFVPAGLQRSTGRQRSFEAANRVFGARNGCHVVGSEASFPTTAVTLQPRRRCVGHSFDARWLARSSGAGGRDPSLHSPKSRRAVCLPELRVR